MLTLRLAPCSFLSGRWLLSSGARGQKRLLFAQPGVASSTSTGATQVQQAWRRYTGSELEGKAPRPLSLSQLSALQIEAVGWRATCVEDVTVIARASLLLNRQTGPDRWKSLDSLVNNLQISWPGREKLSLQQSLTCLAPLKQYAEHDEKADRLLELINEELVSYLEPDVVWSLEDIATALEYSTHCVRNTIANRRFLTVISKQLTFNSQFEASPSCVSRILLALRLKYSGLLVDGRGSLRMPDTTNSVLAALPDILDNVVGTFGLPDLLEIVAQFKNLNCFTDDENRLYEALERQLSKSYDIFEASKEEPTWSGNAVANALLGLRMLSTDSPVAEKYLKTIGQIMRDTNDGYHVKVLLKSLNGLRGMSSQVEEVRQVLDIVRHKIATVRDPRCRQVTHEFARLALAGMQSMNSESAEVKAMLATLTPFIITGLNESAFAQCLFYIRNMNFKDAPFIFNLLLHHFSEFDKSPEKYTKSHWEETSQEGYKLSIGRFLKMGRREISGHLRGAQQAEFEKLYQNLSATLPLVESIEGSSFMSKKESLFFNALKKELYGKKNIQVKGNVYLLCFEADVLLTAIDEITGEIHMIVNIEIDFSQRHTQVLKQRNHVMRDRYLMQEHGIVVLRLNQDVMRRALAGSASVVDLLIEAADNVVSDRDQRALLKQLLLHN